MAVPLVAAAVVGAIAVGAFSAATTSDSTRKLARAYQEAADEVRAATKKYSGQNAFNEMQATGDVYGRIQNQRMLNAQLNNNPNNNSSAMANAAALQGDYSGGYDLGQANANSDLNARYNAATTKAQNYLGQANVNYKANQARLQGGLQAAQDMAKLGGQLYNDYGGSNWFKGNTSTPTMEPAATSDERMKGNPTDKGINNDSGLPASDIEDSLRQLETVQYKYKDPSVPGCDGEVHESGFTAQSAEKTPLFNYAVKEGKDGVKRIDNWKLQEALTAGMAQLQREIDELKDGLKGEER